MQTMAELQALTDRVMGVVPPRSSIRPIRPRRSEMILAMALLFTSAACMVGAAQLSATGHLLTAARLFVVMVFLLMVLLRFG